MSSRHKTRSVMVTEQISLAYENLPVAVYLVPIGEPGRLSYVNPQFEQMLGFSYAQANATAGFWQRQIHPEDRDRVRLRAENCEREGVNFEAQYRMLTCQGAEICVQDHARLVFDDDGLPLFRLGVLHDITAEMRSEKALRESETRYRELVENMSDGVAVYRVVGDAEGFVFQQFNQAAERITGLSREQVIGKTAEQAFPGLKRLGLLDVFREVWRRGRPQHHPLQEYRDHRLSLWVDNYVFKLPSGEVVAIFEDVTEKTRIANALKVTGERLHSAQAYAGLGYWELMSDGVSAIWSEEVYRIFGIDKSARVGPHTLRQLVDAKDREKVLDSLKCSLSQGIEHHIDYRVNRPDGQQRWVECRGKPIVDSRGKIEKVQGFIQDITKRKQVEQDLLQAKSLAEQANSAKSRFLAAASHDLRQPLQALSLLMSALSVRRLDQSSEQIVDDMKNALRAMEVLLNALLDISKLEAQVFVPERNNFHASAFLQGLRNQFKAQAEANGVRLRLFSADVVLYTDINLLGRIVQNFISNAINHGRGDRVLIGCRRAGSCRRIEVWDRGEGIPEQHLDSIFEEFFQLGNPARDLNRGLGLGLAIAKRVADLLQLEIGVRSRPGRGSVFFVEVPAGGGSTQESARSPARMATGKLSDGHILVVDDDHAVLNATRHLLDQWGYKATCVATAEEALETVAIDSTKFSFALLDYRLPNDWNGVRLFTELRNLLGRELPSILLTGDTSVDELREVKDSGLPVLHKPIDTSELYQLMLQQAKRPFSVTTSPTGSP